MDGAPDGLPDPAGGQPGHQAQPGGPVRPDPSAQPARHGPAQPTTDLEGLAGSRWALDAHQTGEGPQGPPEPPRPPSDLTATMPIIVIPPDAILDSEGRLARSYSEPGGRHRGGMRMPRGVPIAVGFIAAVGAGIGLVFAATGGGSQPARTSQLGAQLPDAGAGLPTTPTDTATDGGGTVTDSATPDPSASAGNSSSRASHPSTSRGATPQPSASQSSAAAFSVPQSSGQPSAPAATQGPGTAPTSVPTSIAATTPAPTPTPTPTPTSPTTTRPAIATCHATWTVVHSWTGGFQLGFTVTNSGSVPTSGWTVSYSWPSGQTATDIWDASATQSGSLLSATNLSYDGAIPAGGSATFGLLAKGNVPSSLPGLQCNAR